MLLLSLEKNSSFISATTKESINLLKTLFMGSMKFDSIVLDL